MSVSWSVCQVNQVISQSRYCFIGIDSNVYEVELQIIVELLFWTVWYDQTTQLYIVLYQSDRHKQALGSYTNYFG